MCATKSMILLKDRVYCPAETDSHSDMVEALNIRDYRTPPIFVKVEITPPNNDFFAPVSEWVYRVVQDEVPEWYIEEIDKPRAFEALEKWALEHIFICKDDFEIKGGGYFYLKDCKNVKACDSATVKAWGSATVKAWGSATVKACDSATVEACDSATVEACDRATVEAWGSATVEAWGSATVEAWGSATVINPEWSSAKIDQFIISRNATIKDCKTKTIYQAGDWKFEKVVEAERRG